MAGLHQQFVETKYRKQQVENGQRVIIIIIILFDKKEYS